VPAAEIPGEIPYPRLTVSGDGHRISPPSAGPNTGLSFIYEVLNKFVLFRAIDKPVGKTFNPLKTGFGDGV
jgi:hypothetical protein